MRLNARMRELITDKIVNERRTAKYYFNGYRDCDLSCDLALKILYQKVASRHYAIAHEWLIYLVSDGTAGELAE